MKVHGKRGDWSRSRPVLAGGPSRRVGCSGSSHRQPRSSHRPRGMGAAGLRGGHSWGDGCGGLRRPARGAVSISVPAAVLGGGVLPGAPLPRHGSPERQRGTVRRAAAHPTGPHPLLLLCPSAPPCAASSEPAASVSPPRDLGSSPSLSGQHPAAGRESSRHPGQAGPCKSWLLIVALGLGG